MKNSKLVRIIIIVIFTILAFAYLPKSYIGSDYKLVTVFEKNLTKAANKDYSDQITKGTGKFSLLPYPFAPTYAHPYPIPSIIYVDQSDNVFLKSDTKIEIFSLTGNSLLQIDFPEDFGYLDYYSWDQNNFYIFLKQNNEAVDIKVFRIDLSNYSKAELSNDEARLLNVTLLPPSRYKEKTQNNLYLSSVTNENGNFYGLALKLAEGTIFNSNNAKFLDPSKITILKFDRSFTKEYSHPIEYMHLHSSQTTYKQYIYDEIDLENIFSEKIVCIGVGNTYVDKKGNVFIDGIKSNTANRIIMNDGSCSRVEVEAPTFFLIKLEHIQ